MKKVFLSILSLLVSLYITPSFGSVQSPKKIDPCNPRIRALPTKIYCTANGFNYAIHIETYMSDSSQCSYENNKEIHTARISITAINKEDSKNNCNNGLIFLENGEFSYSLSVNGVSFNSEVNNLHLQDCVSPVHGGFSVGN